MKTDINELYDVYKADPSKDNLGKVVTGLKPTIDYQLASLGSYNDPVMRSKAYVYAADAVQNYDPERSALPTFVSSQLRKLSRARRSMSGPLKIPERMHLDRYALARAEAEFLDSVGREPDDLELSDKTGFAIKKIQELRAGSHATPTEAAFADGQLEKEMPDYLQEATDYVYHDADHIDRKILELKAGHGKTKNYTPMKAKDIAARLKISPSQVSRRSLKLSKKINELKDELEA